MDDSPLTRLFHATKDLWQNVGDGVCVNCPNPVEPPVKICAECRDRAAAAGAGGVARAIQKITHGVFREILTPKK